MDKSFNFGITKEQFTALHNLPGPLGDDIIEVAENMFKGFFYVRKPYIKVPNNVDNFDWTYCPNDESKNTYQLYLFSLYPLVYALKAFDFTGNTKYADLSLKLLQSWFDFIETPNFEQKQQIILSSHCIALRTESLIYCILVLSESDMLTDELRNKLLAYIRLHANQLCDDAYYSVNHNHGVFQDKALLYVACLLGGEERDELVKKAVERLTEQRNYAFTEEMISVENSYDYHIMAIKLFTEVSNTLSFIGGRYTDKLTQDFKKAYDFLTYFLKPNGFVPLIGDSKDHKISMSESKYFTETLEYAATRGKKGVKPQCNCVIYPKSGYMASRQYWAPEDSHNGRSRVVNAMWTAFKSGYVSTNHKHADDLSFMMFCKGHDIFVDTGVFSYSGKSKMRSYFSSALAHNTVIVDGKSYMTSLENCNKTGFFAHESNENYCYCGGFNNSYDGVQIDRHFYSFDESAIIYDNISSDKAHSYSQLFHLGPDMSIVSMTDDEVVLKIAETGYFVKITQMLKNTRLTHFYGENKDGVYGMLSTHMNEIQKIHTLKFDADGENVDIVTLISVLKPNEKLDCTRRIKFAQRKNSYVFTVKKYNCEEFKITASPSDRIKNINTVLERNDRSLVMINKTQKCKNAQYGWEIFDETGSLIHKEPLSDIKKFKYKVEDGDIKKIKIVSVLVTKDGKEYRSAVKDFSGREIIDLTKGITITASNEGKSYIFKANPSFSSAVYGWQIYKKSENGWVLVYTADEANDNKFKCTFSSSGKFRINAICTNERADRLKASIDVTVK